MMDLANKIASVVVYVAFLLLGVSYGHAQQIFYAQSVKDIYNALPKECRIDMATADTVVLCNAVIQGDALPIAYCWDENKVLDHIGIRFLSGIDTMNINWLAVRFVERELLSLLTTDNLEKTIMSLNDRGLMILINNAPVKSKTYQNRREFLRLLNSVTGIAVNYDMKEYNVTLSCEDQQELSFHFTSDIELMTGMDKLERDIRLAIQLKNHRAAMQDNLSVPDYSYLTLLRDSIYLAQRDSFLIPQINNSLYYVKADSTYNLAFNKSLIAETFANALLVPVKANYTFKINHRIYGGESKNYTVSSHDFDDYFKRDYDRFFGVEKTDGELLTGSMVLYDRNARSMHLAYVTVKRTDLINGGVMNIKLYSNIPMHNLQNLFGTL